MRLTGRGVRLAAAAVAVAGTLTAGAAAADNPLTPADGGTAAAACYQSVGASTAGYRFCRSVQALEWIAAADCRTPLRDTPKARAPEYCGVFDGRRVSEARLDAYEHSWVHRALTLQRGLDAAAPLTEELFPHTHNSFNSSAYVVPLDGSLPAYYPTLTNEDPNQVYSITDQLRMDIRGIEIDVHWVPSPYARANTGGYWVTMCHGTAVDPHTPAVDRPVHVGCSDDRPLQSGLAELARWLRANPHEMVLLYLENQLDGNVQAHDITTTLIKRFLGARVLQPPSTLQPGRCADMPLAETRADMLAHGKQVLIVGNCGPGGWNRWVFSRGPHWDESGDPTNYGAADCRRVGTRRVRGSRR
jgi:hypothetical protein